MYVVLLSLGYDLILTRCHCLIGVTHSDYEKILGTLLECLTDYSTDQRGDVGSWVRAASMETLQQLLPLVARLDKELEPIYLTRADVTRVFSGLLKQSVERIDRVRDCAGAVLVDLLYAVDSENNPLIDVTGRDILATYINRYLHFYKDEAVTCVKRTLTCL